MASEYKETSFAGETNIMREEQTAQGEDIQTFAYESLQHTDARELYDTLETTTSTQIVDNEYETSTKEVDNKLCNFSRKSMLYAFGIILTAIVIGTLTGVIILYKSTSKTSPNIVFKAKGVKDTSPTRGQTMIFGITLVNEGNAYSKSTGIFTAPVKGTYSFSTQFCVIADKELAVAIMVDGVIYAAVPIYDNQVKSCDTADTVAVLHAQSKVWVECINAALENIIYDDSYRMNSFSGYLVHQ